MQIQKFSIRMSSLDEKRFGIKTAKAEGIQSDNIPQIFDFCKKNKVQFLIARCNTQYIQTAQLLEDKEFRLVGTLVIYKRSMNKNLNIQRDSLAKIRLVDFNEKEIIQRIAEIAFRGHQSHYHSDSYLDKSQCDQVYSDWAYRSCIDSNVADLVFVAEINKKILGFITLKKNSLHEGQIVLNAVLPEAQKQGIYTDLIQKSLQWFEREGVETVIVSTQLYNLAPQKVWIRFGFEPFTSMYTFHKWFL